MFMCSPTLTDLFLCISPYLTWLWTFWLQMPSYFMRVRTIILLLYGDTPNEKISNSLNWKKTHWVRKARTEEPIRQPVNGSFTDYSKHKKNKKFQKAWGWAQSIPRIPWWRWWHGFPQHFHTSSTQEIQSECFVGKITSFVLDSTILMLWGEGTLNRTLKNSRENIIPLPGALMEMRIEQKTIQRFFFSGWSLKPDKVSANVWLSQSSADKKKYTIYKLEYNIQRNGPFPVKREAALH